MTSTNEHGAGYGCACVSRDARYCAMQRYPFRGYTQPERCECLCHQWGDDEAPPDLAETQRSLSEREAK